MKGECRVLVSPSPEWRGAATFARQTCIAACRDKIARKILRVAHRHIEIFKKPPGELFGEERGLPQAQQPSIPKALSCRTRIEYCVP
jgi:hypothetical protein